MGDNVKQTKAFELKTYDKFPLSCQTRGNVEW